MSNSLRSKEDKMSDMGAAADADDEGGADEVDEQEEEAIRVVAAVAGGGGGGGGGGMHAEASWLRMMFRTSSTVLPASDTTSWCCL